LRGVSKDGRAHRACFHPSRLAVKNGEHLRMTTEYLFPCALAVDERDVGLTQAAPLPTVISRMRCAAKRVRASHHQFQEYTMATAAAVKEEPATKFAKDQLKSVIERVERLEEEKKTISDDIRDVYAEAKGNGFDVKALRTIVRLRKQDANERQEQETILETYMQALGMV
jgi:uncharacterized protein (UPF0335 family)